jgi:hypothetical protein
MVVVYLGINLKKIWQRPVYAVTAISVYQLLDQQLRAFSAFSFAAGLPGILFCQLLKSSPERGLPQKGFFA